MTVAKVGKVTSADVARAAGVSRATVSYVLNDAPGQTISAGTRDAVRLAAQELGYRSNPAARRLAGGRGGHVLMLVPAVRTGDQVNMIAWHLTELLAARGIALSVAYDLASWSSIVRLARSMGADTILALRGFAADERAELDALGVTVRGLEDGIAGGWNEYVGHLQVDHLHEHGYRRLAYAQPSEPGLGYFLTRREAGARAAIREHGLPALATAAFEVDGSNAAQIVSGWTGNGISGVVAYNDEVALRVLRGVSDAGHRCPDDLAVIGVDDIPAGQVSFPPLSTVSILPDRCAVSLAADLLHDEGTLHSLDDMIRLVRRAST